MGGEEGGERLQARARVVAHAAHMRLDLCHDEFCVGRRATPLLRACTMKTRTKVNHSSCHTHSRLERGETMEITAFSLAFDIMASVMSTPIAFPALPTMRDAMICIAPCERTWQVSRVVATKGRGKEACFTTSCPAPQPRSMMVLPSAMLPMKSGQPPPLAAVMRS